MLKYWLLARV